MATAPYTAGDRIDVVVDGVHRTLVVGATVAIPAHDPQRRWRLLCRDEATGRSIDLPVYCDDDGRGEMLGSGEPAPSSLPQPT